MAIQPDRVRAQRIQKLKEAAQRWEARKSERESAAEKMRENTEADDPNRVMAYAQREANRAGVDPSFRRIVREATQLPASSIEKVRFLERQIGPSLGWDEGPSGKDAEDAGQPVGRICSSPEAVKAAGYATGFLVSRSLLLTNHHVFGDGEDAKGAYVQFNYEVKGGSEQPGVFFAIDPASFFTSNGDLDYALVAVKPVSVDGKRKLSEFTPDYLIEEQGKILIGHRISIIQYPDGGTKRYAERENKLLDVLDDFLHYSTDTAPGSSGSPCFNDKWEVVALHHSGVPMVKNGKIQRRGGGVWDLTMPDRDIEWVANEGVRVSQLMADLRKTVWSGTKRQLIDDLFAGRGAETNGGGPPVEGGSTRPHPDSSRSTSTALLNTPPTSSDSNATTVIHVHGDATIYVGTPPSQGGAHAASTAPSDGLRGLVEKKLSFDQDYDGREGYSTNFLGIEIPLPGVVAARRHEMVKEMGNKILVLRYHHYSVAMNKVRRFQMWSAANVDYSAASRKYANDRDSFGTDTWTLDPRLPASLQVQDAEFYKPATAIDRGHIVRRDDTCWGRTKKATEYANSDTFHWTNCTPQHERFNQSKQAGLWGQLEDVVKARATDNLDRMSILAGPVLDDDDPEAYGIKYPVKFWKVVMAVVDGSLEAYGFVLDQSPVVDKFGIEAIDFGKFTVHQKSLAQIETLTGVTFPTVVRNADAMASFESIEITEIGRITPSGSRGK